jgi:hypothetical protein
MSRQSAFGYGRMPSVTPVETSDTDAAEVYRQLWRRQDGQSARTFDVLALDKEMAEEMGGLRLTGKHNQNVMQWTLVSNTRLDRTTAIVFGVLHAEDPDETKLREETFMARAEAGPVLTDAVEARRG